MAVQQVEIYVCAFSVEDAKGNEDGYCGFMRDVEGRWRMVSETASAIQTGIALKRLTLGAHQAGDEPVIFRHTPPFDSWLSAGAHTLTRFRALTSSETDSFYLGLSDNG